MTAFVAPARIERASSEPKSNVLAVAPRGNCFISSGGHYTIYRRGSLFRTASRLCARLSNSSQTRLNPNIRSCRSCNLRCTLSYFYIFFVPGTRPVGWVISLTRYKGKHLFLITKTFCKNFQFFFKTVWNCPVWPFSNAQRQAITPCQTPYRFPGGGPVQTTTYVSRACSRCDTFRPDRGLCRLRPS